MISSGCHEAENCAQAYLGVMRAEQWRCIEFGEHIPETTGVHSIIYLRADESMWECVGSCCGGKGLRMKLSQERLGKLASRYPDLPWLRLRQERFP